MIIRYHNGIHKTNQRNNLKFKCRAYNSYTITFSNVLKQNVTAFNVLSPGIY